jgi:hypothetical protein
MVEVWSPMLTNGMRSCGKEERRLEEGNRARIC